MDYDELSSYCKWGDLINVKKMLEESEEEVEIFWNENELLKMSAIWGGTPILDLLIDYYEKHKLNPQGIEEENKDIDENYKKWLASKEYISALQPLKEAIEDVIDSTGELSADVMNIFNKYRGEEDIKLADYDEDDKDVRERLSVFSEQDASFDISEHRDECREEIGLLTPKEIDYSSEEYRRKESESDESMLSTILDQTDNLVIGATPEIGTSDV